MDNRPRSIVDKTRSLQLGGTGRFSLAPGLNLKTPTKQRIPLNAHTPAAGNTRFSIGGNMMTSNARLSLFKTATTGVLPKNTNEKEVVARNVRKIYQFLCDLDGEDSVPEKNIQAPTQNDFILIFERIYETVSPLYELPKSPKLTEQIPKIFAELGYPYQIKTSTLQTIGAAHSWHYLLHALSWLVDFVQKPDSITVGSQVLLSGDECNSQQKAYRVSWLAKFYHEYQRCKSSLDSAEFIDSSVKQVNEYFENNENLSGQIKEMTQALEEINHEIIDLKNKVGRENELRDDIRKTDEDNKKLQPYIDGLQTQLRTSKEDKESVEAETRDQKTAVSSLKEQVALKKQELVHQEANRGIKAGQANAIMTEYNQLKHQLRESNSELESLSKEQWINQPKATETFSQLTSQSRKVSGIISSIADNLNYKFQRFDDNAIKTPRDLYNALVNDLRHEYETIRALIGDEIRSNEKSITEMKNSISFIQNLILMEEEKCADIQKRIDKKALQFKQFSDDAKYERMREQEKIDKFEQEKEFLYKKRRGVQALQQELSNAQLCFENTLNECEARKIEFENKLIPSANKAFQARETIQNDRTVLGRRILAHLNECQNIRFY